MWFWFLFSLRLYLFSLNKAEREWGLFLGCFRSRSLKPIQPPFHSHFLLFYSYFYFGSCFLFSFYSTRPGRRRRREIKRILLSASYFHPIRDARRRINKERRKNSMLTDHRERKEGRKLIRTKVKWKGEDPRPVPDPTELSSWKWIVIEGIDNLVYLCAVYLKWKWPRRRGTEFGERGKAWVPSWNGFAMNSEKKVQFSLGINYRSTCPVQRHSPSCKLRSQLKSFNFRRYTGEIIIWKHFCK